MRIDKFLKVSRIIKRRTLAKSFCEAGRILINGKTAKAGSDVKVEDVITVLYGSNEAKYKVKELLEHVPKDKAQDLYTEI